MHNDNTQPPREPSRKSLQPEVTPLLPPRPPMSDEEYQRLQWIAQMGRAHAAWQRQWEQRNQRRPPHSKRPR